MKIMLFAATTCVLAFISRNSIFAPGTHGFYRFIAWECLLGVFVLNLGGQSASTEARYLTIAGTLLMISLLLVLAALAQLLWSGRQNAARGDKSMLAFERTTVLVTQGIYRYIRHPMYASLLLLGWGFFFRSPSLAGAVLAVACSAFLLAAALVEEAENVGYFGEEYRRYMKRTWRFLPFVL
ncbi:methyltransferase family protein [Sideroxyarcus sp. TK5]